MDEPPQKRIKRDPYQAQGSSDQSSSDVFSSHIDDMFSLEEHLPDDLLSGVGNNQWMDQQMGGNKPPAQGPGPGPQQQMQHNQLNGGDDSNVVNSIQRMQQQQQQQQQQLHQLQMQQNHKNSLTIGQLGSKSPNLQAAPNAAMVNNLGMPNAMSMSMAPNNGGNGQQLNAMQGINSMASQGGMILTGSNNMAMSGGIVVNNNNKLLGQQGPQMHHLGPMQNGPMSNTIPRMLPQHAMARGGQFVGPRMQNPGMQLGQQINQMGGPGYGFNNAQQPQGNVNNVGGNPQQMSLAGVAPQQQRPQMMTNVRLNVPNVNVGPGNNNMGNEGGIAGQAQPPTPSPAPPQSGAPTGNQIRLPTATQNAQNAPAGMTPQSNPLLADPEKRKLIQQQLVLLLHAHKCQRRENVDCTLQHCKTMKDVLNHMTTCNLGKTCPRTHCSSSRQIINHWKNCQRPDCPVCLPLKQTDRKTAGQQVAGQPTVAGGPPMVTNLPQSGDPNNIQNPNNPHNAPQNPNHPNNPNNNPNNPNNQNQIEMRQFQSQLGPQAGPQAGPGITGIAGLPGNQQNPQQIQLQQAQMAANRPRMAGGATIINRLLQGGPMPNAMLANNQMPGNVDQNQNQNHQNQGNQGNLPNPGNGGNGPQAGNQMQQNQQMNQQIMQQQNQVNQPQQQVNSMQMFNNVLENVTQSLSGGGSVPNNSGQMPGALGQNQLVGGGSGNKDWHQSITPDLRNHLVHKLVQAIFPTSDIAAMYDKRMSNLVAYARKVEGDMYEMANSRSEYYHLLAEKIYKIQKELEEKRQKRKELQILQIQQGGAPAQPGQQLRPGGPGVLNQFLPNPNNMPRLPGNLMSNQNQNLPNMMQGNNRMMFNQNSMGSMVVGAPGPSPGGVNSQMLVPNPGLSPFANIGANSSGMTPPSGTQKFMNGPLSNMSELNQFNEIMNARMGAGHLNNQNQAQSPFACNQLNSLPNQSRIGGMGSNSGMNAMPPTPTSADMANIPVPSPSPSLNSNGPVPVSTPNPPSVSSMQPHPEPTPPPSLASPLSSKNCGPASGSAGNMQQANSSKGGGIAAALAAANRQTSMSNSMSSQMAALEAASKEQDYSPPPPPSPQNTNRGKFELKQEDDMKHDPDSNHMDNNNSNGSSGGGKHANNDGVNIKKEIKTEPMDMDCQNGDAVKDEKVNIKEEPMSPGSMQDCKSGIKTEIKQHFPEPITQSALDKKKKCLFKPEELRQALLPTLDKLYRTDPESMPFRQPVDPIQLGIPDYLDIVKKPMDMGSIQKNLMNGLYSDPWEYVDDVWLMFDNAWLYNRKTSRVYRYCTKLSEVFEQEIDPVMQALGYCCGRKYTFNPQVLCCYGKQLCTIPRDAKYFSYQNSLLYLSDAQTNSRGSKNLGYTFCQKCFNDIPGDTVTLGDDPLQSQTQIKKDQFKELKNDHLELEPFVSCLDCGRKQHQICVLYLESIWPQGFVCDNCLKKKGAKRKENKFNAKRLPMSKLGIYIETRVNNFLKKKEAGAGEVHIRVVSSSDKIVEVKPGMRNRFVESGELIGEFPYRSKALFAYEEVDGIDVCFFGMHVQEYGSECPTPNTRRVYIAYLDSVHFFRPRQYRTAVYHEILLGYMDYAKQLGYTMAHIWACPPSEGDDYIFHCHPPEQKIPKPKRLQEWYKKMLDKGMIERTIQDYKDILKQAMEDKLTSAAELPYFEGDFWPNVLEESIKELDQEEEEKRKQAEAAEAANQSSLNDDSDNGVDGKKKGQKKAKKSNKSKAAQRKNSKKSNDQNNGNDLSTKIFATMEKHKEVFFVIRLHSAQSAASLAPIQDPDPLINCDLMDGRDAFLTMARDRHYEFSSLRRAQFSTLSMLYELHNQGNDKFVYTCNNCKNHVETRYHCTVCDDFDLCLPCKDKVGHPHKMDRLGFDLDDGSSPTDGRPQANPQEARKQSIQRCIQSLVHACQCRDANCRLPSCQKMKRVVTHTKNCKRKTHGGCPICKQLIALCCYHAKHCQEAKCLVPFCPNIKHKLKQQQLQQRLQQAQLLRRRVAVMNTRVTAAGISSSSVPAIQNTPSSVGSNSGDMSPAAPSPVSMGGMGSPHPQGLGMKPTTQTPPANVLQVVKQVQAEAARQQVTHGGYGKLTPTGNQMPPPGMQRNMVGNHQMGQQQVVGQQQQQHVGGPIQNAQVGNLMPMDQWGGPRYPNNGNNAQGMRSPNPNQIMPQNQQIQQQVPQQQNMMNSMQPGNSQMIPGMRPNMGGPGMVQPQQNSSNPPKQALQQLMQTLKNPASGPDQQQQILQILKANPQLMAAFIKQRQSQNQTQQGGGQQGGQQGQQVPQQNQQQNIVQQQNVQQNQVGQHNQQQQPNHMMNQGPGPGQVQNQPNQQQQQQQMNMGGMTAPGQGQMIQNRMHPNQAMMQGGKPQQVQQQHIQQQQIQQQHQGVGPVNVVGGNPMPVQGQQQQQQQQQWYKQQMLMQRQLQQNIPAGFQPAPPYSQRPQQRPQQMGGMNQGYQQQQQQVFDGQSQFLAQGMKPGGPQQPGALSSQLQNQGGHQNQVMGPPTIQQQQLMQSVRSPPPIRSPQPTPSPRAVPSPRGPSASPRAQPSPHHMPSHSPAPQGDMHNHLHPHQLPINENQGENQNQMTAQDQLSKFVEQL